MNGHELRVVTLRNARARDVIELQRQTGLGVIELQDQAKEADIFALAAMSFLAQRNAGFTPDFNAMLDGPAGDLGVMIGEPGDPRESEDEAEANPTGPESETLAPADE
ncbi:MULTISPECIES: hypothetical protein [Microbacterium]|uniref:hypothetical protein n=1 Tax=Microbacterium TaxID=33882 RepID=UPI0012E39688|nr:hypothetical protein [Microbacterium sp. Leaf347]